MLVEYILPQARERLSTIESGTRVRDAAAQMARPHVDLLVVCDNGAMTGVVTKTDVIAHLSRNHGPGLEHPVDIMMTRDVAHFRATDPLIDVWDVMKTRGFQRIPIVGSTRNPIGVVYAPDVLQGLLAEAENEDELLRDYISGFGGQQSDADSEPAG